MTKDSPEPSVFDKDNQAAARENLVGAQTRRTPEIARRLLDWQYLEQSVLRMLAGWGREQVAWEDKSALHRHVWEQTEIVRRLRERVDQFPGVRPDDRVSPALEQLVNTALLAPSFRDAIDGVYEILLKALVQAYSAHSLKVHPVHDAPTVGMLHEINTVKEQHWLWYRDFRRRWPHSTDASYRARLQEAIAQVGNFQEALSFEGEGAKPCGVATDFQPSRLPAMSPGWQCDYNIMPYIQLDFCEQIEARRLFWAIGYMREKVLPDQQLLWLWYGHAMPWDYTADFARHLWDESRHGDSGRSRLQDWGIGIEEVGIFPDYGVGVLAQDCFASAAAGGPPRNQYTCGEVIDMAPRHAPMDVRDLYEAIFGIGMIAETAHFVVKNEGYEDFREATDYESAEMMLFDIIDESQHVQYAHRWLPVLAERGGFDASDYKQRASRERRAMQKDLEQRVEGYRRDLPREAGFAPYDHYQDLLARIRSACPIEQTELYGERTLLPM